MEHDDEDVPHYVKPRIVVGVGIFGLVGVLALFDAIRPDYMLDSIQLALMLGTGGVILGVEPLRRLIK